jgi:hypothetical protein
MKVWLVIYNIHYEANCVRHVFAKQSDAEAKCAELNKERIDKTNTDYEVEEHEVE